MRGRKENRVRERKKKERKNKQTKEEGKMNWSHSVRTPAD
jgi:hypothetical protein